MSICILGVFSNNIIGIEGSYLLGISHGFCSPGLFIAVGGILYDRYHNRILFYYNGLLSYMPIFSLYFIILSFANIGTPLSSNFIGEFFSLYGCFNKSPLFISIATFSVLLSAIYQFKLTSRITSGFPIHNNITSDLSYRESFLLLSTILPILFIGIFPNFIFNSLYSNISNVLYIL
jgi:NADH-ubiquinone oxidoreductase chain 4